MAPPVVIPMALPVWRLTTAPPELPCRILKGALRILPE
jgi:hypothetical protein